MIFFPILECSRVLKMEWNNNANCSLSLGQHLSSGASLALPPPPPHPSRLGGGSSPGIQMIPEESESSPRPPCTRWESILSHPLFVYIRKADSMCPEGQHFTLVVNGDLTRLWQNIILCMYVLLFFNNDSIFNTRVQRHMIISLIAY